MHKVDTNDVFFACSVLLVLVFGAMIFGVMVIARGYQDEVAERESKARRVFTVYVEGKAYSGLRKVSAGHFVDKEGRDHFFFGNYQTVEMVSSQ